MINAVFLCAQVILTKLDVYEKSLKEAQRSLLTKATWGEPILPQPEVPMIFTGSLCRMIRSSIPSSHFNTVLL